MIEREVYPEAPPRVEYRLTSKGRDLAPIVQAMRLYGEQWLAANCVNGAVDGLPAVVANPQ